MYQQVDRSGGSVTESDPVRGIECEMDLRVRHVYPPVSVRAPFPSSFPFQYSHGSRWGCPRSPAIDT